MEKNRRPKTHQMRCKKHPKHRQSPGVCSICLGEKLSQLSSTSIPSSSRNSKNTKVASVSSSSSSLSSLSSHDSSSNASSCSSPMHYRTNNYRKGLEAIRGGYVSFLKLSGKNSTVVLTKSRSMEFYPPRRHREIRVDDGKKKGGFWSKIIGSSRSKKMDNEGLMHSRTTRERFSTRVH